MPELYARWTEDLPPATDYPHPRFILFPYVALDGTVWELSPALQLLRNSQPVATIVPPADTIWHGAAVWQEPDGRVVIVLSVDLPDHRRFEARAYWYSGGIADHLRPRLTPR